MVRSGLLRSRTARPGLSRVVGVLVVTLITIATPMACASDARDDRATGAKTTSTSSTDEPTTVARTASSAPSTAAPVTPKVPSTVAVTSPPSAPVAPDTDPPDTDPPDTDPPDTDPPAPPAPTPDPNVSPYVIRSGQPNYVEISGQKIYQAQIVDVGSYQRAINSAVASQNPCQFLTVRLPKFDYQDLQGFAAVYRTLLSGAASARPWLPTEIQANVDTVLGRWGSLPDLLDQGRIPEAIEVWKDSMAQGSWATIDVWAHNNC